jgi:hypothetical protein
MNEFWPWYRDIDEEWVLDVYDLALGFYKGRYPKRSLALALKFAEKVRSRVALEAPDEPGNVFSGASALR